MKITQTQDTMTVEKGGASNIIVAVVLIIIGIGMSVLSQLNINGFTGDPLLLLLIGVALGIGGVVTIIFASSLKISMQKGGTTTVTKRRVVGGKEAAQTFPTSDIQAVNLSISYQQSTNTNTDSSVSSAMQPQGVLALMLQNGSMIQIATRSGQRGFSMNIGGMPVGGNLPLSKEATTIAEFLGVQSLNTNPLSMMQDVLHMGNQMTSQNQTVPSASITPIPPAPVAPEVPQPQQPTPSEHTFPTNPPAQN